jgi:hypothetical protein
LKTYRQANNSEAQYNTDYSDHVSIAKWYDDHLAAISITNDNGNPLVHTEKQVQSFMVENGLTLDYELITEQYLNHLEALEYLLQVLIPNGFGYYGHGHAHIDHDILRYHETYRSFRLCYETIQQFGLKPVGYAYPYSKGNKAETRRALADAGFLSGRMHSISHHNNPFIMSDSILIPEDWYGLPTLVMQDYAFNQCDRCINNTAELIPYLEETLQRKAWLILTYHSIGDEEGWGFYKMSEFETDMSSIKERDFWNASLNDITLYSRQREKAKVKANQAIDHSGRIRQLEITLSHSLSNAIYGHPLTIVLDVPVEWLSYSITVSQNNYTVQTVVFDTVKGKINLEPSQQKYLLTRNLD